MDEITYGMVEERHSAFGLERVSYGIEAFFDLPHLDLGCIVASVHDLSADRLEIEDLVEMCNRLKVAPEHLDEIVADWMVEHA